MDLFAFCSWNYRSNLNFQAFEHISDSYKFTSKTKQEKSNTKAESLMKSHDAFKKAAKNHKICYINRRFGCLVSVDKSTRVCVVR